MQLSALIALLFDTGLLILIWLVQLVVYPGLNHYSPLKLKPWHRLYTKRITYVVLPLLLGQLVATLLYTYSEPTMLNLLKSGMVIIVWILTFSIFVPLHGAVDGADNAALKEITKKLIQKNWSRTLAWTLIFLISIIQVIIRGQF